MTMRRGLMSTGMDVPIAGDFSGFLPAATAVV